MENLLVAVKSICQPIRVIVPAAPPVQDSELNCNIQIANAMCMRLVNNMNGITFMNNDSFLQRGLLNFNLFQRDGVHLNIHGT